MPTKKSKSRSPVRKSVSKKSPASKGKTKVVLKPSTRAGKKYMVTILQPSGRTKTVHFGASGMSDYTKHKDKERMGRYTDRHRAKENWTKSGIGTAGFWSKWLLWNKPSIQASKADISRRFGVQFVSKL